MEIAQDRIHHVSSDTMPGKLIVSVSLSRNLQESPKTHQVSNASLVEKDVLFSRFHRSHPAGFHSAKCPNGEPPLTVKIGQVLAVFFGLQIVEKLLNGGPLVGGNIGSGCERHAGKLEHSLGASKRSSYAKTSITGFPSASITGRFAAVFISVCGSIPSAW